MTNFGPVLIADDEPNDVLLIQLAFRGLQMRHPFQVAADGEEAVRYLAGEGEFADRAAYPFPVLLLLDLKMPMMDGFDVLRWLNRHPDIKARLPVVVLSSSRLPQAVETVNRLGVQDFLQKPMSFGELRKLMRRIKEQWLGDGA